MNRNSFITFAILAAALAYFTGGMSEIRRADHHAGTQAPAVAEAQAAAEAPAAVTAAEAEAPESEVKALPAQEIKLSFRANPTTGFRWMATEEDNVFEIEDSYAVLADEGILGAGGTQSFRLVPKHAGTGKITFSYERPFQHNSEASRTYLFEVDPDMQIRFVGVTGHNSGVMEHGAPFEIPEITSLT